MKQSPQKNLAKQSQTHTTPIISNTKKIIQDILKFTSLDQTNNDPQAFFERYHSYFSDERSALVLLIEIGNMSITEGTDIIAYIKKLRQRVKIFHATCKYFIAPKSTGNINTPNRDVYKRLHTHFLDTMILDRSNCIQKILSLFEEKTAPKGSAYLWYTILTTEISSFNSILGCLASGKETSWFHLYINVRYAKVLCILHKETEIISVIINKQRALCQALFAPLKNTLAEERNTLITSMFDDIAILCNTKPTIEENYFTILYIFENAFDSLLAGIGTQNTLPCSVQVVDFKTFLETLENKAKTLSQITGSSPVLSIRLQRLSSEDLSSFCAFITSIMQYPQDKQFEALTAFTKVIVCWKLLFATSHATTFMQDLLNEIMGILYSKCKEKLQEMKKLSEAKPEPCPLSQQFQHLSLDGKETNGASKNITYALTHRELRIAKDIIDTLTRLEYHAIKDTYTTLYEKYREALSDQHLFSIILQKLFFDYDAMEISFEPCTFNPNVTFDILKKAKLQIHIVGFMLTMLQFSTLKTSTSQHTLHYILWKNINSGNVFIHQLLKQNIPVGYVTLLFNHMKDYYSLFNHYKAGIKTLSTVLTSSDKQSIETLSLQDALEDLQAIYESLVLIETKQAALLLYEGLVEDARPLIEHAQAEISYLKDKASSRVLLQVTTEISSISAILIGPLDLYQQVLSCLRDKLEQRWNDDLHTFLKNLVNHPIVFQPQITTTLQEISLNNSEKMIRSLSEGKDRFKTENADIFLDHLRSSCSTLHDLNTISFENQNQAVSLLKQIGTLLDSWTDYFEESDSIGPKLIVEKLSTLSEKCKSAFTEATKQQQRNSEHKKEITRAQAKKQEQIRLSENLKAERRAEANQKEKEKKPEVIILDIIECPVTLHPEMERASGPQKKTQRKKEKKAEKKAAKREVKKQKQEQEQQRLIKEIEQATAKQQAQNEALERAQAKLHAETLERAQAKLHAETLERAQAKLHEKTLERTHAKLHEEAPLLANTPKNTATPSVTEIPSKAGILPAPLNRQQLPMLPQLKAIMLALKEHAYEAYIFGGYPRDHLLGKIPKDVDLCTTCPKEKLISILGPDCYPSHITSQSHIFKITTHRIPVNIVCLPNTLSVFLTTLDCTLNTLICDAQGNWFDPTDSIGDFQAQYLKSCTPPDILFPENPQCILRFIRFHHQLKPISPEMLINIQKYADLVPQRLPWGVYIKELGKLFLQGYAVKTLIFMIENSLLTKIIPALTEDHIKKFTVFWEPNLKILDDSARLLRNQKTPYHILGLLLLPMEDVSAFFNQYSGGYADGERLCAENAIHPIISYYHKLLRPPVPTPPPYVNGQAGEECKYPYAVPHYLPGFDSTRQPSNSNLINKEQEQDTNINLSYRR